MVASVAMKELIRVAAMSTAFKAPSASADRIPAAAASQMSTPARLAKTPATTPVTA